MVHKLFRIPLLVAAAAMILAACSALTPTAAPATVPPAGEVKLGTVSGRIALQTNRDGNLEIYVMDGDGSGLTNLTNNPAGDGQPVWSPDGTQIIFWSSRDGNKELYVMNADGSHQTRVTNTTPSNSSWSSWH